MAAAEDKIALLTDAAANLRIYWLAAEDARKAAEKKVKRLEAELDAARSWGER